MRIPIKFFSVILIATMLVVACGSDNNDSSPEVPETTSSAPPSTASPPTTATPPATNISLPTTTTQIPTTTEAATTTSVLATTTTTDPAPAATTTTLPDPLPSSQVNVKVFNGSGVSGAAGHLTRSRFSADYNGLSPANAPDPYSVSTVYYLSSEYFVNALDISESLDIPATSVQRLTAEIAESLGLDIPEAILSQAANYGAQLSAYSGAHVIIVIGRDQMATSLAAEIAQQRTISGESEVATAAATTTAAPTTARPRNLFPTATTTVPSETSGATVSVQPSDDSGVGGPPAIPQITFGESEVSEAPNIRVVVQDGPDEGGRLRYLVRRGSELNIEVLSSIGAGTVRVAGYNLSDDTSLFSGARLSFTANRSGVHNVTFTPDSTGEAEIIFQIEVS